MALLLRVLLFNTEWRSFNMFYVNFLHEWFELFDFLWLRLLHVKYFLLNSTVKWRDILLQTSGSRSRDPTLKPTDHNGNMSTTKVGPISTLEINSNDVEVLGESKGWEQAQTDQHLFVPMTVEEREDTKGLSTLDGEQRVPAWTHVTAVKTINEAYNGLSSWSTSVWSTSALPWRREWQGCSTELELTSNCSCTGSTTSWPQRTAKVLS